MKKLSILVLVLVLLTIGTLPAHAAGKSGSGNSGQGKHLAYRNNQGIFGISGTISSINPGAHTITVYVACGKRPYNGQTLTIQTTDQTRFLQRNSGATATPINFEALASGQKISINGQVTNDIYIASRVTVGAQLSCLP